MKTLLGWAAVLMAAVVGTYAARAYLDTKPTRYVIYDCRSLHGGWHPDVPIEVQKKCRELK